MLFEALTTRKTVTVGEKLIVPYKLSEVTLRPRQQSQAIKSFIHAVFSICRTSEQFRDHLLSDLVVW